MLKTEEELQRVIVYVSPTCQLRVYLVDWCKMDKTQEKQSFLDFNINYFNKIRTEYL